MEETKGHLFDQDRGERATYKAAKPTDDVLLPITRDGFEAFIEVCVNQFTPPLPIDDSIRKVLSGYVHHMTNEQNTTTIEKMSKVLYKSISNALTWTIDQQIKQKVQKELATNQEALKLKAVSEKIAKAEEKRTRKSKVKLVESEVVQTN